MALKEILLPDIGDVGEVEVIEILVAKGDSLQLEDSLITVESDKASMEIPAPFAGKVDSLKIKMGDKIKQGDVILMLEAAAGEAGKADNNEPSVAAHEVADAAPVQKASNIEEQPDDGGIAEAQTQTKPATFKPAPSPTRAIDEFSFELAHASPGVRKFARELGVDLGKVTGSGKGKRILRDDIKLYTKQVMGQGSGGISVSAMPDIDFSQWGDTETLPLSKINRLTGTFMHRNWVTVPHVTQFDEADITDLEIFRKSMVQEYKDKGVKLTLLVFLMKAVVSAMKELPRYNSSLDSTKENLVLKSYFNIGIAVDTEDGLVVPVIRDVDRKNLMEIASELTAMSQKARDKKLRPADLQGGCFTISSLGGIGGTSFTPIVNAPEVAILGVSRAKIQPVWNGEDFAPRQILPLSLSYDHRVIDGADGARFTTFLSRVLSDTRRLLL